MGYQITSKVMVGLAREPATERMTDEVWEEILRQTGMRTAQQASEHGLDWPKLALGRGEQVERDSADGWCDVQPHYGFVPLSGKLAYRALYGF